MEKMAGAYPELRDEIVARLTTQLDIDEPDNEDLGTLRGFLIDALVELGAEESIPSIIRAYEETWIDQLLIDWSYTRERLGIPADVAPHLDQRYPPRRSMFDFSSGPTERVPAGETEVPAAPASSHQAGEPYRCQNRKAGRNEPCPCGSSKKYKRCHGR